MDPLRNINGGARHWTFIDSQTGAVVADYHRTEDSVGDFIVAWQYPLHSGKALGWPGRLAILFAGLVIVAQLSTGLVARAQAAVGAEMCKSII